MPRQITPEDCRQIRNRPDGRFFVTFSFHDHDGVTIGLLGGEYRFQTFGDTLFPQSQSHRFWEYSCGRGNFPDWSIIIVRSNFKKNQEESLKDLARFFKEYMPRYGYKYLCTEGDNYKYYQTLGLKLIYQGIFDQNNYGLPIKDLNV